MLQTHPAYVLEVRRQLIELIRVGRKPADLAREVEPTAQAIRNWIAQADRREGRREVEPIPADAGLAAAERGVLVNILD